MKERAIQAIQQYYDSFNQRDMEAFFAIMTEDVIHDINQDRQEIGKPLFREFMERVNQHGKEKAVELTIFSNENGSRAASEFFVEGTYTKTAEGLPEATGQKYRLRCGAFFELKEGKIHRVTSYYNMNE